MMPKVATALCASAAIAALAIWAPADARPAGGGGGGGGAGASGAHPPAAEHLSIGRLNGPCDLPSCRGGGDFRAFVHPAGPGPSSLHPPATQHLATSGWKHPCDDPTCHHHHDHHHHYYYSSNSGFYDFGETYIYEPAPDCWRWSYSRHRWIWVCGPYAPND